MAGAHGGGARRRRAGRSAPPWWQPPRPDRLGRRAARPDKPPAADQPITGAAIAAAAIVGPAGGRRRAGRRRAGAGPVDARARQLRVARRIAVGGLAAVLLGPVLAFGLGYLIFAVPDPDEAVTNQVALVSYTDGSQLTRLVPEEGNRTAVAIADVPQHVRDAVLAAEDRTFYSNPGFDLTGILRAAWNQLRGGSGGGSTITQQYVKNALVGNDYSLWRKYKEVVLAVKISQERSKDEILGDYLNAIYFGRGAYGVQAASQAYFGKPVQLLDVSEGAMLAGLIQSPSRWDPAVNAERARERWDFVLDGMLAQGWLTAADRPSVFPATVERRRPTAGIPAGPGGHIVHAVQDELDSLGITDEDLAQEGLRITTTIDPVQQEQAVAAAEEALDGQPDDLRTAMVAIDPATGGITAYYGGENGVGQDYATARRLAGSTFKPFVVLAGLQQDPPVGLGEVFDGEETSGLRNADGADCPRCDLKQAMTVSNNVIFTTLAREVGPQAVADAARAAGITAPLDDPDARLALGNKEVSALELASAYATIASGGIFHPPHFVAEVVRADGTVLYRAPTEGERRFPERVARNVTEAMLGVAAADDLTLPGSRPVAAKTGTVQHRIDGENNDAWMAGFVPSLASSVWVGTDQNDPIRTASGDPIAGRGLPGEVWQEFMGDALDERPVEEFPPYRAIGEEASQAPPRSAVEETPAAPTSSVPEPTPDPDAPPPVAPAPDDDPDPAEETTTPPEDDGLLFGTNPDCQARPCG